MYRKNEVTEQPSNNFTSYFNPEKVQDKLHSDAEHIFSGEGKMTGQRAYEIAANRMRSF